MGRNGIGHSKLVEIGNKVKKDGKSKKTHR